MLVGENPTIHGYDCVQGFTK